MRAESGNEENEHEATRSNKARIGFFEKSNKTDTSLMSETVRDKHIITRIKRSSFGQKQTLQEQGWYTHRRMPRYLKCLMKWAISYKREILIKLFQEEVRNRHKLLSINKMESADKKLSTEETHAPAGCIDKC